MKNVKTIVKVVIWVMVAVIGINYVQAMLALGQMILATKSISYDKSWGMFGLVTIYGITYYKTLFSWITYVTLRPALICGLLFLKDIIDGKVRIKGIRAAA